MPFNQKTPFGYAVGTLIQLVALILVWHIVMLGLGMIIGYFGVATACAKDIQRIIQEINENYKIDQNDAKNICEFRNLYRYSSKVKELRRPYQNVILCFI